MHELADQLSKAADAIAPFACRSGCAHCCSFPVGVTFEEALRLRDAVNTAPRAERDRLRATIAREALATESSTWSELAGRACPLLQGGTCSLYHARPLPCRALGSTDAEACARAADGEAVPVPFSEEAFAAGLALGQVLDAHTGNHGHRELRTALALVLATDDENGAVAAFARARDAGGDASGGSASRCGTG